MDKDLKAQLEDQLYERMSHENEAYLAELRTKPADEIINSAYQISCRGLILDQFEEDTSLTVRQLQVLLERPAPLRTLYEDWCTRTADESTLIWDSIHESASNVLRHRAAVRYSDPKTPLYKKSFDEAYKTDETYEWRADHMQSHHCNRMFAEQAERAHHNNGLQEFLLEWTKQYGLERCIFVLSCTISDRKDDGRFYPPARQATARFANQHAEYDIFEMADLTNGVHSGIINLAMENLLKMERERDRAKPKDHAKNQPVR